MARQVALGSDRGSRRPNPAQGKKRKEKGPAHTAGHIRAPREHQVFITGIPMKQLQEKNPHIGENTTNKATHTDLGLGLPPAMRWEGSGPQPGGPLLCPRGQTIWSLAWRPGGSRGWGELWPGRREQRRAGGPHASAPGPAQPPNLVRRSRVRPPSPRGRLSRARGVS